MFVLLGLGEAHGDKAFQWTFNNINSQYEIKDKSETSQLESFTAEKKTDLLGDRSFYLFNFSDQHVIGQTLSIQKVRTHLAFDVNILTKLVAQMRRWRIAHIYRYSWIQKLMIKILKKGFVGSNIYGLKAVATVDGKVLSAQLTGKDEGKTTALVSSLVAQKMYLEGQKYGVQHIHQLIDDIPAFIHKLQMLDPAIQFQFKEN